MEQDEVCEYWRLYECWQVDQAIPYHLGMSAKSHMMAYDKQLTNFTLMYDEEDVI
jgi:hypothetical protein